MTVAASCCPPVSAATRSGCARNWRSSLPAANRNRRSWTTTWPSTGSQEPLAEPIDRGFNRLAWAVPYLVGAGGLAFIGTVAVKWSRRRDADDAQPGVAGERVADSALESRLDDELRDLD